MRTLRFGKKPRRVPANVATHWGVLEWMGHTSHVVVVSGPDAGCKGRGPRGNVQK